MPIPSSLIDRLRPDPRDQRRASRAAKRSSASSRESTTSPAGLPSSLVIFASIRLSEIPTEQVSPVSLADLGRDPPHRRLRREEPGQVEVGLVEPDHLDRLDVAPQHLHHLAPRPPGRRGSPAAGRSRPAASAAPPPPASPSGSRPACAPRSSPSSPPPAAPSRRRPPASPSAPAACAARPTRRRRPCRGGDPGRSRNFSTHDRTAPRRETVRVQPSLLSPYDANRTHEGRTFATCEDTAACSVASARCHCFIGMTAAARQQSWKR